MGSLLCIPIFPAFAEPLGDAKALVEEGEKVLKKASKVRKRKKRAQKLSEGLRKISEAYLLLTTHELQNDAPELLSRIGDQLARTNALSEIAELRQQLLAKAIDATIAGKLPEAHDALTKLKELDPRDPTVDYALTVVEIRMEEE